MKKGFFFFVFLGMFSCNVNELNDIPNCEPNLDPYSVSMTDALDIASSFMTDKEIIPATRAENLSVCTAFSINDKTNEPLFHVVNYDGGGFVVIAGDMRLMPIQAYSPTGSFENTKESYSVGLKKWLDCAEAYRDNALENGVELDNETQLAWLQYKSDSYYLEKRKTRSLDPIIGPPQEYTDTLVGPYIEDSWHQDWPYNDSLQFCTHYYYPNGGVAGQYKPVVGSTPLAIARVLRYIEKPYNYSWSSMPNSVPQTSTTVSFVRDVHYAVKAYADSHGYDVYYYLNGGNPQTSVSDALPIGAFLCDQYGYPAAITETYSSSSNGIIRRELIDHHLPCILSGHSSSPATPYNLNAWICDGYRYYYYPTFGPDGEFLGGYENKYLHHCWGLANCANDGWFTIYDYSSGGNNYNNTMKITHRIAEIDYWSFGL